VSARKYNWRRDGYDARDYLHASPPTQATSVDLRDKCPEVYDQGQLGSCTGNAIAAALEIQHYTQTATWLKPSRLFIYYNERAIEGDVPDDAGAQIRDGISSVVRIGACLESAWPYDIAKFAERPPPICYSTARSLKALAYARVPQSLDAIRATLAEGHPVVFGFSVYDAFESDAVAQSGVLDLPGPTESELGGHAVLCVGYDDATSRFLVRNSWGASWGQGGYFTMPMDYLIDPDLASDLWVIKATR
jgi:C1A family cysteine protease